jgi:hypothetical protein
MAKKNLTHNSQSASKFDAQRSIRELQNRVSKLEQQLQRLTDISGGEDEIPTGEAKRPGPKPAHVWSIRAERDRLVRMLEDFWPEIEPLCTPRPNPDGLRKVLTAIANASAGRDDLAAKHLLKHLPKVVKFLSGDRFRRDPRQIANAFAGSPQVSIWRSLKICQAEPCNDPIGNRAIRAYIRRKHLGLYRDLQADLSLVKFASALKRYRSTDPKLKMYSASTLYRCWKGCSPRYESLEHHQ